MRGAGWGKSRSALVGCGHGAEQLVTGRMGRPRYPDVLTPAEWRVLEQIRGGKANAEIAVRLGVSINTVRYHVSNMLAKLEQPDRHALASWAGEPAGGRGWLRLPPLGLSLSIGVRAAAMIAATAVVTFGIVLAARGGEEEPTPGLGSGGEPSATVVVSDGGGLSRGEIEAGVLLLTGDTLIPLDPRTAEPLAGYAPVDVPIRIGTASPDGSLFALIYGDPDFFDQIGRLTLELIDGQQLGLVSSGLDDDGDGVVRRWEIEVDTRFVVSIGATAWAADSKRLYAMVAAGSESELWAFDVAEDTAELLATSPRTSARLNVSPDGATVYLRRHGSAGTIAAIDATNGDEIKRIRPFAGLSTTVVTASGERLYAFGASHGEIAVIDLDLGEVERTATLPDAAFRPSFVPYATDVSPDGRWLYVSAMEQVEECPELSSGPCITNQPLGLQVIDLETMEIVHHESGINWFSVSPDGRWVVGTGVMWDFRGLSPELHKYQTEEVGFGVKVIEVGSWEVVAHLEPGTGFTIPVFSPAGRYVYLTSRGTGAALQLSDPACVEDCSVITVIDLEQLEVIAARVMDEEEPWGLLLAIPPTE